MAGEKSEHDNDYLSEVSKNVMKQDILGKVDNRSLAALARTSKFFKAVVNEYWNENLAAFERAMMNLNYAKELFKDAKKTEQFTPEEIVKIVNKHKDFELSSIILSSKNVAERLTQAQKDSFFDSHNMAARWQLICTR